MESSPGISSYEHICPFCRGNTMTTNLRYLPVIAAALLSACAITPSSRMGEIVIPAPKSGAAEIPSSLVPAAPPVPTPTPPGATDLPILIAHAAINDETDELQALIDRAALPDLWSRVRVGFALPDLDTPAVERFADRFAETDLLTKLGPRARRYLYFLVIEAEKRGLPSELALLPIIESGLNPQAQSFARAAGLCQFIPETGRRFGLQQSALADQRKDVACVGAMYDYLAENADRFGGDWLLALAAYNWGENAVARAIERNAQRGLPGDFLALRLPNETRAYVPQLLAIRRLIQNPGRYAIELPEVPNRPTIDCEVPIPGDMDVDLAARLASISVAEFRQLNAGVRRGVIPKATHPTICLPFDSAVQFQVQVVEHPGRFASLGAHTVANRTTIVALAKRYRTTPEAIRLANDIPPGMRLKPGATVLVPRGRDDADIPAAVATHAQLLYESETPPTRKVLVRIKRHDTLAGIAARHGVTVAALRKWNPSIREPLKAGQKLAIHIPRQTTSRTASVSKARRPTRTTKRTT